MSPCHETSPRDVRIAQLRAVFWSMRTVLAAARGTGIGAQALLYELHAMADAGLALAECEEPGDGHHAA